MHFISSRKILALACLSILCMAGSVSSSVTSQINNIDHVVVLPSAQGDGIVTNWAVIVGVGAPLRDFRDTTNFKFILEAHGWESSHILCLWGSEATYNDILHRPVQWLNDSGADADDLIVFYFTMHGTQINDTSPLDEPDGLDEIIIPFDYDAENHSRYIKDEDLALQFDEIPSQSIIIIFETCSSGGMIDGDNDLCKSGRVILTSCLPHESSWPFFLRFRWMFPYYLMKGLKGPADANDDGTVDISDAILTLNYLFGGGSALPAPGADRCGVDPTESLSCEQYDTCR